MHDKLVCHTHYDAVQQFLHHIIIATLGITGTSLLQLQMVYMYVEFVEVQLISFSQLSWQHRIGVDWSRTHDPTASSAVTIQST